MKKKQKSLLALKVNAVGFGWQLELWFNFKCGGQHRGAARESFSLLLLLRLSDLTPSPEFAYCSVTSLCHIKKQMCQFATVCLK